MEKISFFSNQYSFLNNDHVCLVHYDGLLYASVTHAFQAARTLSQTTREQISKIHDIETMYELVENIEDPPEWNKNRVRIMEILIRDKFRRNYILRERLSETGSAQLQNNYQEPSPSNLFWGTVNDRGENTIGKILMKIRSDIQKECELENWVLCTFDLITETPEMPRVILHVYKNDERLRKVYLEDKRFYTIGTALDCDLKFKHDSIDAYHAIILFDRSLGLVVIDLNSNAGTYVDGSRLKKSIPAPIENNDCLYFGEKRKKFKVEIYVEHVRREYEKQIREIDRELQMLEKMQNPGANLESIKESLGMTKVRKVRVENIPKKLCTEKDLRELFGSLGEFEYVDVSSRRYEGVLKFKTQSAADAAVKWNGMNVQNRRLKISYYTQTARSRSR